MGPPGIDLSLFSKGNSVRCSYEGGGGGKYWGIRVVNEAPEARSGDVNGGGSAEPHIHVLPPLVMGETGVTVPESSGRH